MKKEVNLLRPLIYKATINQIKKQIGDILNYFLK